LIVVAVVATSCFRVCLLLLALAIMQDTQRKQTTHIDTHRGYVCGALKGKQNRQDILPARATVSRSLNKKAFIFFAAFMAAN